MWEFAARILSAGLLVGISGWTGVPDFGFAWRAGLLIAGYAAAAYILENRRATNPGLSGIVAAADSFAVAFILAYAGVLEHLGLLVCAPIVYAVTRRASYPAAMGPIGAAAVLAADRAVGATSAPSALVFAQAGAVMIVSLLANQERVVVRPKTIEQMISELAQSATAEDESKSVQALIDLREKYRQVSISYRELEKRSRIDRIACQLFLSRSRPGSSLSRILDRLRTLLEANGVMIHLANRVGDRMVVAAVSGRVPVEAEASSVPLDGRATATRLLANADEALASIRQGNSDSQADFTNIVLRCHGRTIGMLTVFAEPGSKLESVRSRADEIAEAVGQVVFDELERANTVRRRDEAELLYEIACRLDGAMTEADLGKRCAKSLHEILRCEHLGVWLVDGVRAILLGQQGRACDLHESLRIGEGGIRGWIRTGAPGICAYSTAKSTEVDGTTALKKRFGSYLLIPVQAGDLTIGFLSAGAAPDQALGPDDARILRQVAGELAHAFSAIHYRRGVTTEMHGILSISEFQRALVSASNMRACLAYVEPLQLSELTERVGAPTVERATRKLGLLLRRHAPRDAKICGKPDGSFVALLPGKTLGDAESWTREITALAAMISYDVPGQADVPMAVRVRVADLDSASLPAPAA